MRVFSFISPLNSSMKITPKITTKSRTHFSIFWKSWKYPSRFSFNYFHKCHQKHSLNHSIYTIKFTIFHYFLRLIKLLVNFSSLTFSIQNKGVFSYENTPKSLIIYIPRIALTTVYPGIFTLNGTLYNSAPYPIIAIWLHFDFNLINSDFIFKSFWRQKMN